MHTELNKSKKIVTECRLEKGHKSALKLCMCLPTPTPKVSYRVLYDRKYTFMYVNGKLCLYTVGKQRFIALLSSNSNGIQAMPI